MLAGMLICATALAGAPSIVLKLGGIDLARPESAAVVHERIQLAASKVCLNLLDDYGPSASTAYSDCVQRATEAAFRTIAQRLPTLSRARAGGPEHPIARVP